jgi:hypothetical protein
MRGGRSDGGKERRNEEQGMRGWRSDGGREGRGVMVGGEEKEECMEQKMEILNRERREGGRKKSRIERMNERLKEEIASKREGNE